MSRFHRKELACWKILVVALWVLAGCQAAPLDQEHIFLIRVGDCEVSVLDYRNAVELAKAAYSHSVLQDPEVSRALQLRVLRELTEELILRQRAVELGITVSPEEVQEAERKIRADYPDKLFEETFLENAVSYSSWRQRLENRLLMAKLMRQDLESRVRISPEDVAQYYQAHKEELDHNGAADVNERIVKDLHRQKTEQAYLAWLDALRKKYRIEINIEEWQRISGA